MDLEVLSYYGNTFKLMPVVQTSFGTILEELVLGGGKSSGAFSRREVLIRGGKRTSSEACRRGQGEAGRGDASNAPGVGARGIVWA